MHAEVLNGGNPELVLDSELKGFDKEFELIRMASKGDRLAFKELYEKNVGRVYAVCLRFVSDIDKANDLTQEVFIKAWEKLSTFHFQSKFSTWLHSIATNNFLMHKRSEKRLSERLDEFGHEEARKNIQPSNSFHFDANIDLENAISELPEKMRAAFILYDVEGYKHHEVATMLGIEEGTSKAHVHRARKLLREKLV